MKPRFEPDIGADASVGAEPVLVDPEAYDAAEQQFAATLDDTAVERPRFVAEEEKTLEVLQSETFDEPARPWFPASTPEASQLHQPGNAGVPPAPLQPELLADQNLTSWKQEVAARVNNYRGRRRTRGPRYPSLQLKFEEPDWNTDDKPTGALTRYPTKHALALDNASPVPADEIPVAPTMHVPTQPVETARVIEFPRSGHAPPRTLDELADPVFDRPRILEAPELAPSPPALGGILIETADKPIQEKRPGLEIPLQAASMSRRLLATTIDAVLVLSGFALFAYIFFRVTAVIPPAPQATAMSAILLGLFWAAFQCLMLVYAGTTPGLTLAKLQLSRFDGNPVPRAMRRWRVLTSVLSGVSLGLGFAWCFLDEDSLCWHDRITRTYIAPKRP